jgi:hypothetical protein
VHPDVSIIELSCHTGAGLDDWLGWLSHRRAAALAGMMAGA